MRGHHESESWEGYGPVRCVEIGLGVCLRPVGRYAAPDDYVSGYIIAHAVDGLDFRCEGFLSVDREDGEAWTASGSLDDGTLTLSPSVLCTRHPEFHAHVVDGRWTG